MEIYGLGQRLFTCLLCIRNQRTFLSHTGRLETKASSARSPGYICSGKEKDLLGRLPKTEHFWHSYNFCWQQSKVSRSNGLNIVFPADSIFQVAVLYYSFIICAPKSWKGLCFELISFCPKIFQQHTAVSENTIPYSICLAKKHFLKLGSYNFQMTSTYPSRTRIEQSSLFSKLPSILGPVLVQLQAAESPLETGYMVTKFFPVVWSHGLPR